MTIPPRICCKFTIYFTVYSYECITNVTHTHAAARPGAERDEGVVMPVGAALWQEVVRVEARRLGVHLGVAMHQERRQHHRRVFGDHIAGRCQNNRLSDCRAQLRRFNHNYRKASCINYVINLRGRRTLLIK